MIDRPEPASSPPGLVTDAGSLAVLVRRLARERRIALDTEAASFHRYVDRVYLLQLSSDRETVLVDPLRVADLSPIGELLADRAIEKILHDADYDLRILDRDYGFRITNVFDTRIAAQLAGEPAVGLNSLLHKYFDVSLNKKYQRADWSRRPLTPGMIAYAADDTRFLPPLRDTLEQQLTQLGRLSWAREEFARLEELRWTPGRSDSEHAYLRLRGARRLTPQQMAVLRALYQWREERAQALDRAPFRVVSNAALITLAQHNPPDREALAAIRDIPPVVAKRYGEEIIAAVSAGHSSPGTPAPHDRRSPRRSRDPGYDQRLERLKALRNTRSEEAGLAPGLLCPNGTLQAIARAVPHTADELAGVTELRDWQRQAMGETAILAAVLVSDPGD